MIKIAIVTITQNLNYGNRLQNYALQTFLKKMNLEVDTVIDTYQCMYFQLNFFNMYHTFGSKGILKYALNYKGFRDYIRKEQMRWPEFHAFNETYIHFSPIQVHYDKVPKELAENYDYFIVGSDQVWNPNFKCTDFEFLTFAPKKKRIAYAASFGIAELPHSCRERFKNWLKGMASISVREAAGAAIVESLANCKAEVVVDPTLLLCREEWEKIARRPPWLTGRDYLLTYFLGEKPLEVQRRIEEISRKHELDVIELLDARQREWFCVGPDIFLYLVQHASFVYTDSFHGTVFSILLQTPFVVCERMQDGGVDMTSRIDTLLEIFNMQERRGTLQNGFAVEELFDLDFSGVEEVRARECERSLAYLRRALYLEGGSDA